VAAVPDEGACDRYASGQCSLGELARLLGVSRQAARDMLSRLGIAVRRPGRPTGSSALARVLTEGYLRREYLEHGRSVAHVADELGCTRKTVRRYLADHGIERRPVTRRGAGPVGPLEPVEAGTGLSAEALWEMYAVRGRSTTAIAEETGCAASTVARDLRRKGITLRRRGGSPAPAVRRRARQAGIRLAVVAADSYGHG
jgi:transposase-like protein